MYNFMCWGVKTAGPLGALPSSWIEAAHVDRDQIHNTRNLTCDEPFENKLYASKKNLIWTFFENSSSYPSPRLALGELG